MPEIDFTLGKMLSDIRSLQASVGRLERIKLNIYHACRVYRSTTQAIDTGVNTALSYDTEVLDTDACFAATSSKIYSRTNGFYIIGASAMMDNTQVDSSDKFLSLKLQLNGSVIVASMGIHSLNGKNAVISVVSGSYLAKDEYFEAIWYHELGSTKNISAATATSQFYNCAWLARV